MTDEIKNEQVNTVQLNQQQLSPSQEENAPNKKFIIISIVAIIVILTLVILAAIFLLDPAQSQRTEQIRDVFIIFLALESLIIGVALVVLIIQLSTLINLLQNEIRPIINSTNETVNTLKGTAQFVSDHLTEPVIKINQFMAMIKKIIKPSK
jgi:amino acid permease